ncbi:hypothetical protein I8U17_11405 [Thermoactinomyces sp. CICC 10521]|uniref:DeoR-like transcriptional repressor C-terminal sensor domain-containing protein n=1 Tax=Thermoactinomyces daqus TaxID=1329516 RepID=A0A7W1XCF2_9BACL|nr:hypothetical protein [Thermoactinomyces daqus]MBH8608219.1 hypothetical protein [Thermoactinomyces sp. CICC 10521]
MTKGITHSPPLERESKKAIVTRRPEIHLLIDHHTFSKYALITYCSLDEIDCIITDTASGKACWDYAEQHQIRLVAADQSD